MSHFSVDPDIASAKTLSKDFYTSDSIFQSAKEKIFSSGWQFIGDTSLVSMPGQVYPFTLLENYLDEPLVLTRDKQNQIHCLSNVCTHRGNIIVEEACKVTNLRCKYHGRQFHLDGRFLSMPEFKEVKNFPSNEDNLSSLPLFQWGNLLFTSLARSIDHDSFFGEMIKRLEWLPLNEFQFRPELYFTFHSFMQD